MKHLSRDKLAKYHRFSYIPRYYKEDSEAFQFRVSTIKRQLEDEIAPEKASTLPLNVKKQRTGARFQKFILLTGLVSGFVATLFFLSVSVYSVAILFVLALAFVKISKR